MAKITKIKASDPSKPVEKPQKPVDSPEKPEKKPEKKSVKKPFILFRPFIALGHYLRDSWREIRQVRWPSRKATWKMVFAVIIYAAIIMAFILLLDAGLNALSNLILS